MRLDKIPLEGNLDGWAGGFDVPELLLAVCATGRSGRLDLVTREAVRKLFLHEGTIVFASSDSPDDRLGTYLLLRNELRLAELRRLSPRVRPGLRLGTLLVENGILRPDRLESAVLEQVRAIVLALFRWPEAAYRFVEGATGGAESITMTVPAERWILDGIEKVSSWRRVSQGVGSFDTRYSVVSGNEGSLRSLDLDTQSLELLAHLRHPRSVEEICLDSELPDISVCRRLWAFRLLGWVTVQPEEPFASLDSDIEALKMIWKKPGGDEP